MLHFSLALLSLTIMTPPLTSTFKLTLLASVAIHAAAALHWGGNRDGFHQANAESTLNIKLSQAGSKLSAASQIAARPATKQKNVTSQKEQQKDIQQHKPAGQSSPTQSVQSGELRKSTGQPEPGLEVRQQQYISQLLQHLDQYKTYPYIARHRRLEGSVNMQIQLATNGELLQVRCLTGHAVFCQAASETARQAAPMPQPPELTSLRFEYAMEYRLH